jgi:hypothetical protein
MKPRIVIVVYKPLKGKERGLEAIVSKHLEILKNENLVTDRLPIVMRSANGCIVEVFEWLSQQAIQSAHTNPEVLKLWNEFSAVCEYEKPVNVEEFNNFFSEFEPITLTHTP